MVLCITNRFNSNPLNFEIVINNITDKLLKLNMRKTNFVYILYNFNINELQTYSKFLETYKSSHNIVHIYERFNHNRLQLAANTVALELAVTNNIPIVSFPAIMDDIDDINSIPEYININSTTTFLKNKVNDITNNIWVNGNITEKVECKLTYETVITLKTNHLCQENTDTTISVVVDSLCEFIKNNCKHIQQINKVNDMLVLTSLLKVPDKIRYVEYFNSYFDMIYVLNMDRDTKKWAKMQNKLHSNNIYNFQRFMGYDGKKDPHLSEWKEYMKLPLSRDELKFRRKGIKQPGSWAILKSMKRLILDAKQKSYTKILTLQDDVIFHKDFIRQFHTVTTEEITDWDVMYLGASQHDWKNNIEYHDKYYKPNGSADGAFAVAIHESCYDELLAEIEKFTVSFDSGPLRKLQVSSDKCYIMQPNLIIADLRESDLRGYRDMKGYSNIFKWDLNLYKIDEK